MLSSYSLTHTYTYTLFPQFGDTVNVASRMESTGVVGSVQISCSLAEIISKPEYTHKSGKYALVPRNELVEVKGKGMMKTFFLETSK